MRLKEIREKKGVKQKAVAEAIGRTRQCYGRWELEPWRMSIGEANAVCEFLGVSMAEVDDFRLPREVILNNH